MQKCIDHLATVIDEAHMVCIVGRLNDPGNQRLPAMWELVILDALSHAGKLRHEISLASGRRPDFELTAPVEGHDLLIVGDIAAVSDSGLDEQNPIDEFGKELNRLVGKAGLSPCNFSYRVHGDRVGRFGDGRMKLYLPKRGELPTVMKRAIAPWLTKIVSSPNQTDHFDYVHDDVRFSLAYDPAQLYPSGSYLSYDVAASREKNPLFNALRGKIGQLRSAPDKALRLIVACDGDCALLSHRSYMSGQGTFSAREVAEDFLRKNSSIDAVLLASIDEHRELFQSRTTFKMRYELVVAPKRSRSARMDDATISRLEELLRKAVAQVPRPIQSAYNAVVRCREPGFGHGMFGAYKMKDDSVRLSSRAIQRLLAGETTLEQFFMMHGWDRETGPSNPFSRSIREGQMISRTEIEPGGDNDDDWFVFTFGSPDPAISQFVVPEIGRGEGWNILARFWRFLHSRSGQRARSRATSRAGNSGSI